MCETYVVLLRKTLFLLLLFYFPVSPIMAATIVLTERDTGSNIEIQGGDHLQVVLDANPSTGYVWEAESIDSSVLRQGDKEYISDARAFGASGRVMYHFKAIAPGETPLRLVYHRPFEEATSSQKHFEVSIKIK